MILAGGLSTRLYPLTKTVPKPLVPVMGQPNIYHVIRYLKRFGITEIATNLFYFADAIRDALGDGSRFGVRLEYVYEKELSGSAGAVKLMEAFLRDSDPCVVVGCDDLTNLDLDAVVDFHRRREAIATIGLVQRDDVSEYGVVVLDARAKITGFQEKPAPGTERSRLVNTGIYVFSPEIFEKIPADELYDFGKQVFPELQEAGESFYGYWAHGAYWCDIGTPGEYRRVTNDVLTGNFTLAETRATGIDSSAIVEPGAAIEGPVWIGPRVAIGAGARVVGPALVDEDTVIGAGALLERSIVWRGSKIGEGARIADSIVGTFYDIAPSQRLDAAIVANETQAKETA
jgi:NDP-sugar pyrophosphorylase family protein